MFLESNPHVFHYADSTKILLGHFKRVKMTDRESEKERERERETRDQVNFVGVQLC